ncbi:MAG TPA: translation elongation factor Ts [Patescibacteria group bacterium]|nr:translation elongation factor Ts [Patescibacteria group bacterium]
MTSSTENIKKLREQTSAGVLDIKEALDQAEGDVDAALKILKEKGASIAAKKAARATSQGLIETYTHMGRVGAMVEVNCETDFVARNTEFKELAHELVLQVASLDSDKLEDLLAMELIKEPSKTVQELITEKIAKLGENIRVRRFCRYVLGGE